MWPRVGSRLVVSVSSPNIPAWRHASAAASRSAVPAATRYTRAAPVTGAAAPTAVNSLVRASNPCSLKAARAWAASTPL